MKVSKKTLAVVLSMATIFLVGCNDKDISDTSENLEESSVVETVNNENTVEEESKKEMTEEEALKLVEKEIHSIMPEAKLKYKGLNTDGLNNVYMMEYDVPFATKVTFNIDAVEEDVSVVYHEYYEDSMDEYKEDFEEITSETPISADEAKNEFIKCSEGLIGIGGELSRNQLDNLELACDYMIKTHLNYCWVFRYPMEEAHKMVSSGEYSYDNALSKDDKYGYVYIDPYKKEFAKYINAESWTNF